MKYVQLDNATFLPHVCQLIDEGHSVTIRAKGNSMRPFIESDRDSVILGRADNVEVGDVVLVELTKGQYVLHRLDAVQGQRIRLRGDGNPYQVEICSVTNVRAKAVAVVRKGREYSMNSRTWKIYSWFWTRALPLRRYLLALYRLLWLGILPGRLTGKNRMVAVNSNDNDK